MLKSKLKCKRAYKGVIEGELKSLKLGDEFLCSPDLAIKLVHHYPLYFEVIGAEKPQPKPEPKEEKIEEKKEWQPKKNKAMLDYENK